MKKIPVHSMPQVAFVEQAIGDEIPSVHCPVCGHSPFGPERDPDIKMTPCPHLVFICGGEGSIMEFESKDFRRRNKSKDGSVFCFDDMANSLQAMGYGNHLLVIQLAFGGMGGGPICCTDTYGFDYDIQSTKNKRSRHD